MSDATEFGACREAIDFRVLTERMVPIFFLEKWVTDHSRYVPNTLKRCACAARPSAPSSRRRRHHRGRVGAGARLPPDGGAGRLAKISHNDLEYALMASYADRLKLLRTALSSTGLRGGLIGRRAHPTGMNTFWAHSEWPLVGDANSR